MTILSPYLLFRGSRLGRPLFVGLSLALAGPASALSVHLSTGSKSDRICPTEASFEEPGYLPVSGPAAFRFAALPAVATERPASVPEPAPLNTAVEKTKSLEVNSKSESTPKNAALPIDASSSKAPRILPDDTPTEVHPEDILPYFKLPKNGETSVSVPFTPAAPTLPSSSASYELK